MNGDMVKMLFNVTTGQKKAYTVHIITSGIRHTLKKQKQWFNCRMMFNERCLRPVCSASPVCTGQTIWLGYNFPGMAMATQTIGAGFEFSPHSKWFEFSVSLLLLKLSHVWSHSYHLCKGIWFKEPVSGAFCSWPSYAFFAFVLSA